VALHGVAQEGVETVRRAFPMRSDDETITARAFRNCAVIHVPDVLADPLYQQKGAARAGGYRGCLGVPMVREGQVIGVIFVARATPGYFTDTQVELLKTFADQAVIAIENVRLFTELEARNRDVTEALEQQTATSVILQVISSSPTNLQPVFDIIAESAVKLCGAEVGLVTRFDGELVSIGAVFGTSQAGLDAIRRVYPMPPSGAAAGARAVHDCAIVHIPDVLADEGYSVQEAALAAGFRAALGVPMLREGRAIGSIALGRAIPGEFSEAQIKLLCTFADQAVIAVENVRLFRELEARNSELTVALEQQTATSEILRVISGSQTDVQPVFEAMAANALRLCDAKFSAIFRFDGELIHLAALHNVNPKSSDSLRGAFPMPPGRGGSTARAILTGRIVHIPDVREDSEFVFHGIAQSVDYRSVLCVPMLRDGQPIGAITLAGAEARPFPDEQVELLKTFADQALIAIENVRLFKELEARNRDLTAALEQQTATSEILRVISSSPMDVQPTFEAIAAAATTLCAAENAGVFLFDGELIHFVAHHRWTAEDLDAIRQVFPRPPGGGSVTARAILTRAVAHVPDLRDDPDYEETSIILAGFRSVLSVPMLREGQPIGAINVTRREPVPFSDTQIALLETFASQAVIAVENVRLFKELQARTGELTQSVEKLTALGEVSQALSSTLDVETVLDTIVSHASQLAGGAGCAIYEYEEAAEQFELRATHGYDAGFVEALRAAPLRRGEGLMGRAAEVREPIQVPDISQAGAYQSSLRDALTRFGYRALLSVPLLREEQIIGSLSLTRKEPGEYSPEVIEVLKTFATQSALAIQNARLFREIADKSRQLEVASRHKSEFLANMSHELRTPLNAIIGFSEVLNERMFGELNDKQEEYLKDIHASGQHLLSLINDILDLSKIEAGRMELELSDFDLPAAVDNAVTLVRERASRKGVTVGIAVGKQVGMIRGDERKIRQVLLNLLSNAIKFTPQGGRIEVGAALDTGAVEVSVSDTGVGIAPEDLEAVFEEFRQVGASAAKQEGTGLGLALSRKFIELHGGTIRVESAIGAGSTFTFRLPIKK
jgi:two-component system, NtrC family, sensor kinase